MDLLERYKILEPTFKLITPELKDLRVNTLKISDEDLIKRLKKRGAELKKISFLKNGYEYKANFSLGATQEYLQGYYYLQEAASQIVAEELNPKESELICDMSCAPGSKLTHMSQLLKNKGRIIGLDINNKRLAATKDNIERLSIKNITLIKKDSRFLKDLNLKFDKILLDTPCSGNYSIEENFFKIKTIEGIKEMSRLQKQLIKSAYSCLKKGGTLLYSTCSLEPEENELNIDWALNRYEDLELKKLNIKLGKNGLEKLPNIFEKEKLNPSINLTRRFWPHLTNTQGFFIAKFVKM